MAKKKKYICGASNKFPDFFLYEKSGNLFNDPRIYQKLEIFFWLIFLFMMQIVRIMIC